MEKKYIVLIILIIAGGVFGTIFASVYYVSTPSGGNQISLDPTSDLMTGEDVPDNYEKLTDLGWEKKQVEFNGISVENAAYRVWRSPQAKQVAVMGFVCPTPRAASNMVGWADNYWRNGMEESGYHASNTNLPVYGIETESFMSENGNYIGYFVSFRVKNVAVTVTTSNLTKSETESYCEMVEERINNKK